MRAIHVFLILLLVAQIGWANDAVKKLVESESVTVAWGKVVEFDPQSELEIDYGNGHGRSLNWIRFVPVKEGVEVLSIQFTEGRRPYQSKWPSDSSSVTIRKAYLKSEAYSALLSQLAVVNSASVRRFERADLIGSTNDFFVRAGAMSKDKTKMDLSWAGYQSNRSEWAYAKPKACVALVREAMKNLEWKDSIFTESDRTWASAKFTREWSTFKEAEYYWWVRERSIQMIGHLGDKSLWPALRDILANDKPASDVSASRCVYHAINAVTRLAGKDIRPKPIEEMDIDAVRPKVLELIKE